MKFTETPLPGAYVIEFEPHEDYRGSLTRLYDLEEYDILGSSGMRIIQVNHQYDKAAGTIRGMHYRIPWEQKVVMCLRGMVWDVIVDLRKNSPTYLKWHGIAMRPHDYQAIYVPRWFAHGHQSLTDHCELLYFHSDFYDPNHEQGFRYDDPKINIHWPLSQGPVSQKDMELPYVEG